MSSNGSGQGKPGAWLRWFLFSEGLILLLALAGPGYSHAFGHHGDHGLLARTVMDEPGFADAVLVNFVAVNLFIMATWALAWIVTRVRGNT